MPGVDLNYFMRQASKLTEKLEQRKKELAEETVEGQAGDGRVKVVATGAGDVRSIKISPEVLQAGDVGDDGGPHRRRGQRRADPGPRAERARAGEDLRRPEDSRNHRMTPDPLNRLVAQLSKLPGIGEKTAQRLAFHILRRPPEYAASW
jgi:3-methyladenine DNA glycosylase/8-oxoguanine DNA glycosylase